MVQDKVQLQIDAQILQPLQVIPGSHGLIQTVIDDGETPVQVGVEEAGQDVEGGKCPPQFFLFQNGGNIRQGAAHAVGVGIEHRLQIQMVHRKAPFFRAQ